MVYFMLKNKNGYFKKIDKELGLQVVDDFILGYKFSCKQSAINFKKQNNLEEFAVIEVRCL